MVLLTLPEEILEKICLYLNEIDIRRLRRTCKQMKDVLYKLYKPTRKLLLIDNKHALLTYAQLLSNFRWERVDDQLGVF